MDDTDLERPIYKLVVLVSGMLIGAIAGTIGAALLIEIFFYII